MPSPVTIFIEDKQFSLHPTDLEHLDAAVTALRKRHLYTAAERILVVRGMVAAYLEGEG